MGWYNWVLWSYVRLLHKPQCAGTGRERAGWGGRGVCCTITKRIRTAPNPPPITHAYRPTHHNNNNNNNMFDFWSNMCRPQDSGTLPSVNIMKHTYTRTHTHLTPILCVRKLCSSLAHRFHSHMHCLCQPLSSLSLTPHVFSPKRHQLTMNAKSIRVSSQGSIACIQNVLLPSHARRSASVTTDTCYTPKWVACVPQQKCLFLTLCHPIYSLRDLGCRGGKMEEGRWGEKASIYFISNYIITQSLWRSSVLSYV